MLLLLQGSADTAVYMIAGFVVIFGTMFIYLVSLFVRQRNLMRELQALQEMRKRDG